MAAPKGLSEVAAMGNRLDTLEALRGCLAWALETADSSRDIAALSRQLTMVLAEIAELAPPAVKKGTPLDELRERRAARVATPKSSGRAKKSAV